MRNPYFIGLDTCGIVDGYVRTPNDMVSSDVNSNMDTPLHNYSSYKTT